MSGPDWPVRGRSVAGQCAELSNDEGGVTISKTCLKIGLGLESGGQYNRGGVKVVRTREEASLAFVCGSSGVEARNSREFSCDSDDCSLFTRDMKMYLN